MDNKKVFQAGAIITKISTLHDRTLRLQIDCLEMKPEDEAIVLSARNKAGYFLFSEQEISQEVANDIPDIQIEKSEKSPASRLRNVLFRLWEISDKGKYPEFEVFYRAKMELLIEGYKKKLN